MTDLNVTFNTVSLPTGTSGTLTVYEDDSGGSFADRSSSVSLTNGQTSYTLTGFNANAGNTVWPEVDLDNTDVTQTGETVELLSVEPAVSAPSTPQNLTSTVSQDDITLDWDAVNWNGDQGHYDIKRAEVTGGPYTEITTVASGTTTYTNSALEDGERFFYVVEADNSAGASGNSNETAETTALPAPSGLSANEV